MIGVDADTHYAAHRFGLVSAAGGKATRRPVPSMSADATAGGIEVGQVLEFRTASGELLARKVVACGRTECWLRRDLADGARAALAREAAEHERSRAALVAWADRKDAPLAAARGMSIEKFREQRNYAGMRFDRYRAAQRSGG